MVELAESGMTMICVSHEVGFAKQVADRVIFMADGELIEENKPNEFFDHPQHERLRLFVSQILHKPTPGMQFMLYYFYCYPTVAQSPMIIDEQSVKMNLKMPTKRPRRLRRTPFMRDLVRETALSIDDLVLPLFIRHGQGIKKAIASMPGHYQFSVDQLAPEISEIMSLGIKSILLFGIPEHKDEQGTDSFNANGIIQQAIREIKQLAPNLLIMADTCFCEYTHHGHCGVISDVTGELDIDNDKTLNVLAKQAIAQAKAGADIIAPSGMIDGMVSVVRQALDGAGFAHIPILSYAVKYASALYGPFRDAAEGTPSFGDRKTHQMDPANAAEALKEARLDVKEGADMLMVKPAANYLDIIYRLKQAHPDIPLGAYHVSGEFAMIKAAAAQGLVDEKKAVCEILLSIKRSGADFIINYFAKDVATWLLESDTHSPEH